MISGSNHRIPIGFRGKGLVDGNLVWHEEQPWVILRESTREEYLEQLRQEGLVSRHAKQYYYEVSVD